MNEYKVTIIVAIYNSEKYLRKGLDSLAKQTWSNIEVLMMDDGSPDNSGELCDEFAANDSRFIAVHKPNTGACDSRNQALGMATGDYVCFMDGDDWFSEDFVEYMMNILKETGTQMAFSDKLFTTTDQVQNDSDFIEIWDAEKAITTTLYPYMVLGPWNKMYSMKIIKENAIRFPAHWQGETLHFANTVAYYAGTVGVGHRKVYNYRLDNSESGTQINVENRLMSLDNVKKLKYCCFANTKKINRAIEWHLYTNYYNILFHIYATDSKEKYEEEYREAKRYLRRNWLNVCIRSELKFKQRILVVVQGFMPIALARHQNKRLNLNL